MKSNQTQSRIMTNTARRAFTLVELMVVGAVLVMVMVLTLIVISKVKTSAKIAKTRATVQKIDVALQPVFVRYDRKFNRIKRTVGLDDAELTDEERQERQKVAAHFIRDLMRMEMPQSWAEVYNSADSDTTLGPIPITISIDLPEEEESPLLNFYWEAYKRATSLTSKEPNRGALLFLIIQNLNPEALEAFHGSEVVDTDGDGLLEFVDAWGNPIQFLRWAPAFSGSDIQQDVVKMAGGVPSGSRTYKENWWRDREQRRDAMKRATVNHPDPTDERVNVVPEVVGWFLYPLIYSAGPDGKYGIEDGGESPVSPVVETEGINEGILDPFTFPYGMPHGSEHFDNIHNHQWHRSF